MAALRTFPTRFGTMIDRWFRWLWTDAGLTVKMAIVMMIGLLVSVGSFSYLGISATKDSTQQTLQERVTLAKLAAGHLDTVLIHIEQMMDGAAAHLMPVNEQPGLIDRARLHMAYRQLRTFSHQIYLLDGQGNLLLAEPSLPEPERPALATMPSIVDTLQTGQFALSGAAYPLSERSPAVLASVSLQDVEGAVTGALVARLDLTQSEFNSFLQPVALGQTGSMEVVDNQGIILLSTHPDHLLQPSDHKGTLATMIRDGEALVATCHGCHQEAGVQIPSPEVMAFAPLSQATWGVVVRQHQAEAFATARKLQERILILGGTAVLIVLGLVWLLTRNMVAPLRLLTRAANRMAQGNLDTPVDSDRGDEIGILTRTFDDMRLRLRQFTVEIKTWNRELDRRVHERTRAYLTAQAEAQQARNDLQSIIDGLTDELVVVDRDLRVLQANAVVLERWSEKESIVGQPCWVVNHEGDQCQPPNCVCPVRKVFETGEPARVTHFHPHQQDKARYVDIVASPLHDQTGHISGVIELVRDVTQETQTKQALLQRNEELSVLNAVAGTIGQTLDLTEILEAALEIVVSLSGVDAGAIFLTDAESGRLELMVHQGELSHVQMMTARLAANGCDQIRKPFFQREGDCSFVLIPLIAKGTALGLLCLSTGASRKFLEEQSHLLGSLGRQIAMGVENARLYADLQHKEQMRSRLLKKVITAQEEERKHLARELHDETSQALTALSVGLDTIMRTPAPNMAQVKDQLDTVKGLAGEVLREIKRIILDLRPAILDDLGLVQAVDWYAERRLKSQSIRVGLETIGGERRLSSEVETTLFRLAQEAISNVARHARAENVSIELEFSEATIGLHIEDDGCGFETEGMSDSLTFGLLGMQERAALLGGTVTVQSEVGHGTRISVQIPLGGIPS